MKNNTFREIWQKIEESKNILMSLHPKPDGDSLGSCTAMKYVLEKMNKKITFVSRDDLSENLAELEISKGIEFGKDISKMDWDGFDLVIFIDHGVLDYYSSNMEDKLKNSNVLNIDHHSDNKFYGKINYVDANAPSTCSILIELFRENSVNIDKELATRLFIGIATDTGFFTYINSNKAFKDTAFLSEKGADYFNDIFRKIIGNMPLKFKRMYGVLLNNLEIIKIGNSEFAFSFIGKEDIKKYGLIIADLRLGIDIIRNIKDVAFECTLTELDDEIKGSFRSSDVNVGAFARELGGGGHSLAAAFVLKGMSLKEAKEKVVEAIRKVGIHKA